MSRHHLLRPLVVAVACLVLFPASAYAERVVVLDPAGDAQQLDWEQSGKDDPVFLPAPDETSVDIVRTVVAHTRARLGVTVRFRDLARLTDHTTWIRVVTSGADRFDLHVEVKPGGRVRTVITRNDRAFSCRGLTGVVDVGRDRVAASMPAACLGSPRWVEVGVEAEGFADAGTEDDPCAFEMYLDDGNDPSLHPHRWPVLGPRVRRG